MATYCITYDITTPESAEDGEYAEGGFVIDGYDIELPAGFVGDVAARWRAENNPDVVLEPADENDVEEWAYDACGIEPLYGHEGDPIRGSVPNDLRIAYAAWVVVDSEGVDEDNGSGSFYGNSFDQDFRTGAERRIAVHFDGLTDVQLRLLSALVKAR